MGHPHLEFLRWWLSFFQGRNPSVSFGAVLITKLPSGLHYTLCTPDLCGPWQLSRDRVEREQWEGGKPVFQGKSKQHSGDLSLFLLNSTCAQRVCCLLQPQVPRLAHGTAILTPLSGPTLFSLSLFCPVPLQLEKVDLMCLLRDQGDDSGREEPAIQA